MAKLARKRDEMKAVLYIATLLSGVVIGHLGYSIAYALFKKKLLKLSECTNKYDLMVDKFVRIYTWAMIALIAVITFLKTKYWFSMGFEGRFVLLLIVVLLLLLAQLSQPIFKAKDLSYLRATEHFGPKIWYGVDVGGEVKKSHEWYFEKSDELTMKQKIIDFVCSILIMTSCYLLLLW